MASLFDDIGRTDPSPGSSQEDSFSFLNRVAEPFWEEIRRVLDEWFSRYPKGGSEELRRRFRSSLPGQHWAAWWELYLHELFVRLGYQVTPHPALSDTPKRPDFELRRDEFRCLLEAAVVFSGIVPSEDDNTAPPWLLDAVNLVQSPGFFVNLREVEAAGQERLRNRQVAGPLQRWLEGLDPDEVSENYRARGVLPDFRLDLRGWKIHFEAVPVKPEARGKPGHRVLGAGPAIAGYVDDVEQLHDKLKAKAGRYGRPETPMITAALCASSFMENFDIEQALFGRKAIQISIEPGEASREIRQRNGFWMHETGPQNRRVSAVLTAVQLHPWTAARVTPHLWRNPWADHKLELDRLPFPAATATDGGRILYHEGTQRTPIHEILGLPRDWASGPPFTQARGY